MLEALLSFELLGNNIVQYLVFLGVIILSFIGAKAIYWIFSRIFLTVTKKTKSQLDDLLVEALQGPVVLAVLLAGFRYAVKFLVLTESGLTLYNKLFGVGVTITVSWLIMRITNAILKNYIAPLTAKSKNKFDDTLFPVVKNLVNFAIIAITIILILQNLGFEVSSLVAGLGIGGLAFALAAQDLLGNMFGGAAVVTDKPFKIGDRVKVDGQDGFVRKITLRTTTLETFDGTNVVMPNKKIADSTLENISRERMRRVKATIGVTYDTSSAKLEKAKKILADVILKNDKTDDKSLVHFINFGAYSLDIQLIYWIKDLNEILATKDEVNLAIKKAFDKEKIDFAFPTQTLHVEKN
ncbi:MAG: mechanosensitive ion channel family protein [Nanoarchaeota archaeon]|nr:mechanosensitive ion channel family protein [Nanoarchaeota archaeon]